MHQMEIWAGLACTIGRKVEKVSRNLSAGLIVATCIFMRRRRLQFFFFGISLFVATTPISASPTYALNFVDVDENKLSTAGGQVTIMVLANSAETEKARIVGDRIPDFCVGNPGYRFITVLTFETKHSSPARALFRAIARHRLDAEAKRLQARYTAKNLTQNARKDVCAVLDFDGAIAAQFRSPTAPGFQVLALGRQGELLQRWTEVPTAEQLAAVLK
jgi:hypothetical protein